MLSRNNARFPQTPSSGMCVNVCVDCIALHAYSIEWGVYAMKGSAKGIMRCWCVGISMYLWIGWTKIYCAPTGASIREIEKGNVCVRHEERIALYGLRIALMFIWWSTWICFNCIMSAVFCPGRSDLSGWYCGFKLVVVWICICLIAFNNNNNNR